jgi:hypothetical protein
LYFVKVKSETTYFRASVGDTDITAGVALLGELASEELVEFGVEHTVGHKLALLANLSRHIWRSNGGW